MKIKFILLVLSLALSSTLLSKDTFTPYTAETVPQNVTDLWKDYDARKESLDIEVIKEWEEEGVLVRYVTFKVGTFKSTDARIAAYYCFPKGGSQLPAFVWSHGGGQKAEKKRGIYFAKRGYATVDINWLGRPMQKDIEVNTDWGKIDPTLGPRFYKKALRKQWKHGLKPDEFTIDPVFSPRNLNWFALVVAARRAITFLEQQKEVDSNRIGFAGFSMGGMITSMTAIDSRLKAVAPFVGGTAYLYKDFPGIPGSGNKVHFGEHVDLYAKTMDPSAYWPHVKCPVIFINSSNDFHAAFDRVYQSMNLIPHQNWRVTQNIHVSHAPSNEQWIMLDKWFDLHLKKDKTRIPATPLSELKIKNNQAVFSVTPENKMNDLKEVEVYYSYDPNSITRFWKTAPATNQNGTWIAKIDHNPKVPFYIHAICRYSTGTEGSSFNGKTSTYVINSLNHSVVPENFNYEELSKIAKSNEIFEDFSNGIQDWIARHGGVSTYKFQDPSLKLKGKKLKITVNPQGQEHMVSMQTSSRFIDKEKKQVNFFCNKIIDGTNWQEVIIEARDFQTHDKNNKKELEWQRIANFSLSIMDLKSKKKIDLSNGQRLQYLKSIELID